MGNVLPWGSHALAVKRIERNNVKRQERFRLAAEKCQDLDAAVRDEILQLDFEQLRVALQEDKYNAVTVLKAYTHAALEAQGKINCLAEFLIESFEKAEHLDVLHYKKAQKPPLYGMPFSVKGNFYVSGYDCCVGFSKFLEQPRSEDCTLVEALSELGGIPFVLTNIPQALLSFVCSNAVYGTTGHPLNKDRTPGGSSGGEAALLASGGSTFATGSDLAGSLRIPSSMCGLVSIKPTQDRVTVRHACQGIPGRGRMALAYGFITKTVEQQVFLLEKILALESFHKSCPTAVPMPLKVDVIRETASRKMRIGYWLDDGFLTPSPGCKRVVMETVEKLKREGHEMVQFRLPQPLHAAEVCYRAIMTDGGSFMNNLFRGELVDQYMASFVRLISVSEFPKRHFKQTPLFLRSWASHILGWISPQAQCMARSFVRNVEELRLNQEQLDLYQEKIIDMWNELAIDALVCPAFCVPPVEHKWPSFLGACGFATALFNMINFPSGVVPTGTWTKEDDDHLEEWTPGTNFVLKFVKDSSKGAEGLPLSVQVATRPYEEEKCLGVMQIVEKLWR